MKDLRYYTGKLVEAGYLVPSDKQEYFFKANNLKVKRLDNGALVVSINFPQKYIVQSHVELALTVGAVTDPAKKEGLAHFYEHVMFTNKPLLKRLEDNRLNYNASTSSLGLRAYIRGNYNPTVSSFGVEEVLQDWVKNFYFPKALNNKSIIDEERKVIMSEIHNYYSNFENMVWDSVDKIIYHKSNYRLDKTLGTIKSLENITNDDIKSFNSTYAIPKNTVVKISSAGSKNEGELITEKVVSILNNIDKSGKKFIFDRTKHSKFNNLVKQKTIYKNSDVGKNQVAYGLIWDFRAEPFSTKEEAFYEFKKIFSHYIRMLVREELNVYTFRLSSVFLFPDYLNLNYFCIQDSNNVDDKIAKLTQLTAKTLIKLQNNPNIIKKHLELTKEFYKSKVYNTEEIINEVLNGYTDYGLPADINYFKKARAKVKQEHIMYYIECMLKTLPTPFAIGDIK